MQIGAALIRHMHGIAFLNQLLDTLGKACPAMPAIDQKVHADCKAAAMLVKIAD